MSAVNKKVGDKWITLNSRSLSLGGKLCTAYTLNCGEGAELEGQDLNRLFKRTAKKATAFGGEE